MDVKGFKKGSKVYPELFVVQHIELFVFVIDKLDGRVQLEISEEGVDFNTSPLP
jgi:hypothetical protein